MAIYRTSPNHPLRASAKCDEGREDRIGKVAPKGRSNKHHHLGLGDRALHTIASPVSVYSCLSTPMPPSLRSLPLLPDDYESLSLCLIPLIFQLEDITQSCLAKTRHLLDHVLSQPKPALLAWSKWHSADTPFYPSTHVHLLILYCSLKSLQTFKLPCHAALNVCRNKSSSSFKQGPHSDVTHGLCSLKCQVALLNKHIYLSTWLFLDFLPNYITASTHLFVRSSERTIHYNSTACPGVLYQLSVQYKPASTLAHFSSLPYQRGRDLGTRKLRFVTYPEFMASLGQVTYQQVLEKKLKLYHSIVQIQIIPYDMRKCALRQCLN